MELKVQNGQLKLGSAYRLIVTGWFWGFLTVYGGIFFLTFLIMFLTGDTSGMQMNGEPVQDGPSAVLLMLLFLILMPIVIIMHAFMFGAIILLGLVIYRKRKSITVVPAYEPRFFANED